MRNPTLLACSALAVALPAASCATPRPSASSAASSHDEASSQERHGSCEQASPRPFVQRVEIGLDLTTDAPPWRSKDTPDDALADEAALLESNREPLRACVADGESIVLLATPTPQGATIDVWCGARPDQVACVRDTLGDMKPERPFLFSLFRSTDGQHEREHRGSLLKAEIREVIDANLDEVRACYNLALALWPTTQGTVRVKLVIGPRGDVQESRVVQNTTGVDELACCIDARVRTWKYPPPKGCGIVIVTYPFVLEPSG